jgi:hypothetical protein
MSPASRLTLGALYREMRAGLGDAGWARVTVEFRQRTQAGGDPEGVALVLQALVDHRDRELHRAEVTLMGHGPSKRLHVRRHAEGFAYSVDGGTRWGPFTAHPRIFDLADFEAKLDEVLADDVTFEPVTAPTADALDVSLDRAAFARLLRIFSADVGDEPDSPALSAFSVSLVASADVSLVYWWSLTGIDGADLSAPDGPADASTLRITCSVSIRVAAAPEPAAEEVALDEALPPVAHIDEVWALLRRPER